MTMTRKIHAAALLAAAIALTSCGVSVVGGDGTSIGAGGAGGHAAAELGCISGAVQTFVAERYPGGLLATDAQYLYWADHSYASQADYEQNQYSHQLLRTSKADGTTAVIESGLGGVSGGFLDGEQLYFATYVAGTEATHELLVLPKDGSGPAVPLYSANGLFTFVGADPDRMFLLQSLQPGMTLLSVSKAYGATTVLAAKAALSAQNLTEDATQLYWFDDAGMRIASLAKAGGVPQTFAALSSAEEWVAQLGVDAANVYWVVVTPAHATFYRAPKAGGAKIALADVALSGQYASVGGLAIDDQCLYWSELSGTSNPDTGANLGKVHAMRKSDGARALPVSAEPAPGPMIIDESGIFLAAPAATMSPPPFGDPPGLKGAVQRIAR
jgi:hypothetical protein